ncbi:MFS transporter [Phocicoccus schoeneichii]|uniref:Sugar efflux transporter C n=2 Tax=Phocicoccus schoeneichii TaxID=1812261 RepID=A0A6V7R631_9BACL|nr:sugar efflux transporter [Jeotgalicoccus schoeneichii]GGH51611.1 MFS transporter [Jeotgalicoccus schoeneichii]CAD2072514.1 Sugar efflux transporter C [Jeotgalicoccus schoeneichii]
MFIELLRLNNYKIYILNMVFLGVAIAITAPYMVIYMTENHGMTVTGFGLFMGAGAIGSFIVNTIVGRVSDRLPFDRKYLILAALLMEVITYSLFLILNETWILVAGFILFYSLGAPAMPQLYASARESVNDAKNNSSNFKTFANTLLRSMFSFGFLFGPLIGSVLLIRYDFIGLFIGAIFMFFMVFVSTLFIRNKKVPREQEVIPAQMLGEAEAPKLFKTPALLIPFIAFTFLQMGQWSYLLNMPIYVTQFLGEGNEKVGLLSSICAGLEVPFMIGIGLVASRFATKHLLMVAGVIGSMFFITVGFFNSFTVILVGQVFLAMFLAVILGLGISYFQDVLPKFPGYASTLYANGMIVGQLLGNLMGGLISDYISVQYSFIASGIMLIIAVVMFGFAKNEVKEGFQ